MINPPNPVLNSLIRLDEGNSSSRTLSEPLFEVMQTVEGISSSSRDGILPRSKVTLDTLETLVRPGVKQEESNAADLHLLQRLQNEWYMSLSSGNGMLY